MNTWWHHFLLKQVFSVLSPDSPLVALLPDLFLQRCCINCTFSGSVQHRPSLSEVRFHYIHNICNLDQCISFKYFKNKISVCILGKWQCGRILFPLRVKASCCLRSRWDPLCCSWLYFSSLHLGWMGFMFTSCGVFQSAPSLTLMEFEKTAFCKVQHLDSISTW